MNLRLSNVPAKQPLNSEQMNNYLDSAYLDCVSLIGAVDISGNILQNGMLDVADAALDVVASGVLGHFYEHAHNILEVDDEWVRLHGG
jgi:hypothetical protein